jgi:GTP-binding protein
VDIRNIAIVAHVDHGKTTLVDAILRQTGALRDSGDRDARVMDSDDQERERGITIVAKATAVQWRDTRIHIVDTPGHADFGSEVERVLRMVDAVLLLVDAAEGPMPQTRFVLGKSLELGLKALVCINKIDRPDERAEEVLDEVFDLFANLGASDEQLDFPHCYAAAREGYAMAELGDERKDLEPLFQMILDHVPDPEFTPDAPLKMQVATLDASPFLGRIAIGRIYSGTIRRGAQAAVVRPDGSKETFRITKLMGFEGLERVDIETATAGEIIALAGAGDATVGDTICDPNHLEPMPAIAIDEPTLAMTFGPNTSPFAGKEGRFVTSRQIRERLERELIANVGLRVEQGPSQEQFVVSGRGILHISVLIESMRREGFELAVSQPQVILQELDDGSILEPFEEVTIDCDDAHSGTVIEKMNIRGATLQDLHVSEDGRSRMVWLAPSRGLIGYRSDFLTDTRGTGTMNRIYAEYGPAKTSPRLRKNGVLIVQDRSETVAYALANLQDRGTLFMGAGVSVYGGQIIGLHSRENDLVINPSKGKKLTNVRASGTDESVRLTPPKTFTLEEALEFIARDELVEITPKSIRLRKRYLDPNDRKRDR